MSNLLFQADRTRERIDLVSRTDFVQPLTREQRRVLEMLTRHSGRARAITNREIGNRLAMTQREVKETVESLRTAPFVLPICASRDARHGGYFMAATDEERRQAAHTLLGQAHAMMISASCLLEPHELRAALAPMVQEMEAASHV